MGTNFAYCLIKNSNIFFIENKQTIVHKDRFKDHIELEAISNRLDKFSYSSGYLNSMHKNFRISVVSCSSTIADFRRAPQ